MENLKLIFPSRQLRPLERLNLVPLESASDAQLVFLAMMRRALNFKTIFRSSFGMPEATSWKFFNSNSILRIR